MQPSSRSQSFRASRASTSQMLPLRERSTSERALLPPTKRLPTPEIKAPAPVQTNLAAARKLSIDKLSRRSVGAPIASARSLPNKTSPRNPDSSRPNPIKVFCRVLESPKDAPRSRIKANTSSLKSPSHSHVMVRAPPLSFSVVEGTGVVVSDKATPIAQRPKFKGFDRVFEKSAARPHQFYHQSLERSVISCVNRCESACMVAYGPQRSNKEEFMFGPKEGIAAMALETMFKAFQVHSSEGGVGVVMRMCCVAIEGGREVVWDLTSQQPSCPLSGGLADLSLVPICNGPSAVQAMSLCVERWGTLSCCADSHVICEVFVKSAKSFRLVFVDLCEAVGATTSNGDNLEEFERLLLHDQQQQQPRRVGVLSQAMTADALEHVWLLPVISDASDLASVCRVLNVASKVKRSVPLPNTPLDSSYSARVWGQLEKSSANDTTECIVKSDVLSYTTECRDPWPNNDASRDQIQPSPTDSNESTTSSSTTSSPIDSTTTTTSSSESLLFNATTTTTTTPLTPTTSTISTTSTVITTTTNPTVFHRSVVACRATTLELEKQSKDLEQSISETRRTMTALLTGQAVVGDAASVGQMSKTVKALTAEKSLVQSCLVAARKQLDEYVALLSRDDMGHLMEQCDTPDNVFDSFLSCVGGVSKSSVVCDASHKQCVFNSAHSSISDSDASELSYRHNNNNDKSKTSDDGRSDRNDAPLGILARLQLEQDQTPRSDNNHNHNHNHSNDKSGGASEFSGVEFYGEVKVAEGVDDEAPNSDHENNNNNNDDDDNNLNGGDGIHRESEQSSENEKENDNGTNNNNNNGDGNEDGDDGDGNSGHKEGQHGAPFQDKKHTNTITNTNNDSNTNGDVVDVVVSAAQSQSEFRVPFPVIITPTNDNNNNEVRRASVLSREPCPNKSDTANKAEGEGEGDVDDVLSELLPMLPHITARTSHLPRLSWRAPPKTVVRLTSHVAELYEVGEQLGKGGFSVVRRGVDKQTREEVALKIIQNHMFKKYQKMIEREIHVLARLEHPRLVTLRELIRTPDTFVVAMEVVNGGELYEHIIARKRLSEDVARNVLFQILEGVEVLHALGVMHRDLKPENILVEGNCRPSSGDVGFLSVKLTDFGLATEFDGERVVAGTPEYTAPEVMSRLPYGPASDVWSVGVILYVMLSGMPAFYGDTPEVIRNVRQGLYRFPKSVWNNISPSARELVSSILQVDPSKRPDIAAIREHPWMQQQPQQQLQSQKSQKSQQQQQSCAPALPVGVVDKQAAVYKDVTPNPTPTPIQEQQRSSSFKKSLAALFDGSKSGKDKSKAKSHQSAPTAPAELLASPPPAREDFASKRSSRKSIGVNGAPSMEELGKKKSSRKSVGVLGQPPVPPPPPPLPEGMVVVAEEPKKSRLSRSSLGRMLSFGKKREVNE